MVDTLMEATVERLVFVNTPDNAEHVRFDIRQLQEFFASEYIYEDRTADVLRNYLGVVAADSHWREVMHFLFSALVENRRATELAVAVTELERIDRREDSETGIIHLRMASGALLATRLLVEGVFEQDRKVRSQFRTALKPIFALPDDRYFTDLVGMREGTSKAWFINFALEVLRESAPSENIGAMLYLTKTLESTDSRTKDVVEYLRNSPILYRDHVMRSFEGVATNSRRKRDVKIEDWILQYVLGELIQEDWRHLAPDALRAMRMIVAKNPKATLHVAKDVLDENELGLLRDLIVEFQNESDQRVPLGAAEGEISKYDWVTGQLPEGTWTPVSPSDVTKARGLLGVVARILDYAHGRTKEALRSVSTYFAEAGSYIHYILPTHLIILLPDVDKCSGEKLFDLILATSDTEFHTKFGKRRVRAPRAMRPIVSYYISTDMSDADMLKLAQHSASIAVDVLLERAMLTADVKLSVNDKFVQCLLDSPESLLAQVHRFGKLLELFPDHEEVLRKTVTQAAITNLVAQNLSRRLPRNAASPFLLSLPAEAALLPWLANAFANQIDVHFFSEQAHSSNLSAFLEFAPSKDALLQVLEDQSLPVVQHAGAWIYLFMHASSLPRPEEALTRLLSGYKVRMGEFIDMPDGAWFIAAVSRVCMNLPTECTNLIEPLVARLLDSTSNRYLERVHVQRILDDWRERSAAPIHASDLSEKQSVI
ncbi:hypothetical protein D1006_31915 [Burkholderia stabilis]|uniref:Uncharacterized protein n=1 Tax=Burkholderia stabilis TaxID=95485 RepID=A0A4Q2AJM5_9BURK|nr:hypothetical protein [Burkholderia stabilis]RXV69637.1 hypothetical protein D1006_31915 [Burkholderia stabilis]